MFTPEVPQSGGGRQPSSRRFGRGGTTTTTAGGGSVAAMLTEEELENVMENFANEDTYYAKTWTRWVVEKFLGKVRVCVVFCCCCSLGRNFCPFYLIVL